VTNYKISLKVNWEKVDTLDDILPKKPGLKILFVAKTPAPISVRVGHYFQGRQGRMFWNKLIEYEILKVPHGDFEDDHLLEHGYGITDIVKVPRSFGNEPSKEEYQEGLERILGLIQRHKPKVIVFVYKKVLDQILKLGFNLRIKSVYGFNPELKSRFGSEVFVFPMPGTPCTVETASRAMTELAEVAHDF